MPSDLLAARVHPWQSFKLRRYAEEINQNLGVVLAEAIQVYFSTLNLPQEKLDKWLEDYRKEQRSAESAASPCDG